MTHKPCEPEIMEKRILYLLVLLSGLFPLMLMVASFSSSRGWDASAFIALASGFSVIWFATPIYTALLSSDVYLVLEKVSAVRKITRKDIFSIALNVFFIFLSYLFFLLPFLMRR